MTGMQDKAPIQGKALKSPFYLIFNPPNKNLISDVRGFPATSGKCK